jgi:hypothetical protein
MMRSQAAVLGIGPAGMFSAMALIHSGIGDVTMIAGKMTPSKLYGAQYLHAPIPGTEVSPAPIAYNLIGDTDGYRRRVYGDELPAGMSVSTDGLVGVADGWDIRETYRQAWDFVMGSCDFSPLTVAAGDIQWLARRYDIVVSTIPASDLCISGRHNFQSSAIWAAGEAPDLGIKLKFNCDDMTVYCNGLPDDEGPLWYRISNIYGHKTVEWPGRINRPEMLNVARVLKPLSTDCDCAPPNVIRVGRYGAWQKGYLAHQAYNDTLEHANGV